MSLQDCAIVGYAETKIVEKSSRDIWELSGEVLGSLIRGTGIEKGEIDGLILSSSMTSAGNVFWSQAVADQLALDVNFCQTVDIGGCSPLGTVARAAMAIDSGMCHNVLCLFADTQAAEDNRPRRPIRQEWTSAIGYLGPPTAFGFISKRYEHQYGLDYAALGKLAVTQRNHAILNDLAVEKLRKPITVDDYLNSRMIAEPIRLLDCVMVCDGASGVLVTSRRNAEAKGCTKAVVPLGYGERTHYRAAQSVFDITETGHLVAGQMAFRQSGTKLSDVGSFHPYDDFIIAILLQLEMLGFCQRGQGCAYIRETDFSHTGDLPLNTGGGQISAGQAGLAGGGTNLVEAVRQLFGEGGARQVANRKIAVVTGIGGIPYTRNFATSSVMVLTSNA
ncbi:MAG: acetyl-CoA acetyltransferase [Betaproteobacteria bacterium RIFCSPLOWO2_12_FULL_66_14]|nr:MAG: acetyl-CoA acetyltransferase [Betaproteobacteria bacterium RIFCSPLOWO2_12_FULL_66_14]